MTEPYTYESLDLHTDQIRLLRIRPRSKWQKIDCTIEHVSLGAVKAEYNCLSYVWGDQPEEHTILINGKSASIRPNLFAFLLQASKRRKIYSSPIWIDALCLNQSSLDEKNHQVQRMAQIYKYARHVLIWMGPDNKLTPVWSSLLANYYLYHAGVKTIYTSTANCIGTIMSYNRVWLDAFSRVNRPYLYDSFRRSLRKPVYDLSCKEYWSRMWIVQEVMLAQYPLVVFNNGLLPLYRTMITHNWSSKSIPGRTSFDLNRHGPGEVVPLDRHLLTYKYQKCSDPRDHLFALRGLLSDNEAADITVDYSIDIMELFLSHAMKFAQTCTDHRWMRWLHSLGMALGVEIACYCHHAMLSFLQSAGIARTQIDTLRYDANDIFIYHIIARPIKNEAKYRS